MQFLICLSRACVHSGFPFGLSSYSSSPKRRIEWTRADLFSRIASGVRLSPCVPVVFHRRGGLQAIRVAVLWIARTDAPWRDLPRELGNWNSTFRRFRRWVQADVFKLIFDVLSDEPDMEYTMTDATIVKVHRHGLGAKGGPRARPKVSRRAAGHPKSSLWWTHLGPWCASC